MAIELYPAQLDGYDLEIETLDDRFENAIVRHEFPKRAGAQLENMGQRARTVNIRCYFWDHGDHYTYADHIDLINHLQSTELFELVHPQYGVMKGMVETFSTRHDDRIMTAEVDIAFVEELRGTIQDIQYEDVEGTAEDALVDSQQEQMEAFAAEVRAELGGEAISILEQVVDEGQGIYGQFQGYSQRAKNYLKKIDTFVSAVEGTLVSVANPANSVISTISYGTNLPGRVISALARCIERYVLLNESVEDAPSRFLRNLRSAMLDLEDKAGLGKHVRIAGAAQCAHRIAQIYKADEETRQTVRKSERAQSFDVNGHYLGTAATDSILTINDLEDSLFAVRTMLQDGIDQDRTMESLKVMARGLLDHVNTIKLERDKILTVELDNIMPLHIVCHRFGLNYNYAERIASINRLKNPTFTSGEVRIYGR